MTSSTNNFENLVLELFDKQNSKEFRENGRYTFTGCVYMYNSGFAFSRTSREFFEKNASDMDSLYLITNKEEFEKQIFKSQYVSHEYLPSEKLLKLQLRNNNYEIKLK